MAKYLDQSGVQTLWNKAKSKFALSSHTHTKSQISDFPSIPTVYNPTITLKQNGTTKGSFSLNQSYGTTINLDGGGNSNITSLNEAFDGGEIIDYDISSCQSWRIMLCHNNSEESIYVTIAGKRIYMPEALPTIIEIFTNDSNITGVKISGFSTTNSSVVYALTVSNMETLTINTSGISSSTRFRVAGIGI